MVELNLRPTERQLRQFGWIALGAFGLLGGIILVRKGLFGVTFGASATTIAYTVFALGLVSGAFSLIGPRANRPLFVLLTIVTFPIGLVVSHVALAVLFFGLLTPLALVFRIAGRDALHRRWDPNCASYWNDLPEITDKKYYFHQY